MYTEIAMDHFKNPRNVGTIEAPNGQGMAGDPECGDYLVITLKVEKDVIKNIKFKVHGCAGAIATSSMVTELAKGMHVLQAYAITDREVVKALGGLPEEKVHCSLLGTVALKKAIVDYANRRKQMMADNSTEESEL